MPFSIDVVQGGTCAEEVDRLIIRNLASCAVWYTTHPTCRRKVSAGFLQRSQYHEPLFTKEADEIKWYYLNWFIIAVYHGHLELLCFVEVREQFDLKQT